MSGRRDRWTRKVFSPSYAVRTTRIAEVKSFVSAAAATAFAFASSSARLPGIYSLMPGDISSSGFKSFISITALGETSNLTAMETKSSPSFTTYS